MLSGTEWGPNDKTCTVFIAISRSRAAQQKTEKQLGGATRLSELSVFCEQHREACLAGQVNGCPFFWFVFFGQTKKMNK